MNFKNDLEACSKTLEQDGTILYPTDTIWGLGCAIQSVKAIQRIYEIKNRPHNKSMIVLVKDLSMARDYVISVPEEVKNVLATSDRPTSFILKAAPDCPKMVISETGEIAIRIVDDPFCQALINSINQPIISTSANVSGEPSPASFAEISKRILNKVDYVVNWRQNEEMHGIPSRIIRYDFETGKLITIR